MARGKYGLQPTANNPSEAAQNPHTMGDFVLIGGIGTAIGLLLKHLSDMGRKSRRRNS